MLDPDAEIIYAYLITNEMNGKRYIGVTTKAPLVRWRAHLWLARRGGGYSLHASIRKHGEEAFKFEVIAEAYSPAEAYRLERALIAAYGTMSGRGYNLTSGGEQNVGFTISVETRGQMRDLMNERLQDPGYGERLREGIRKKNLDPAYRESRRAGIQAAREKYVASSTKAMANPETRRKISESAKKTLADPEIRRKRSEQRKADWVKPEYRAKHAAAMAACKEKRVAKQKLRWEDPEYKEKQSQIQRDLYWSPEYAEKRAHLNTKRANVSEETRAKMRRAAKERHERQWAEAQLAKLSTDVSN